MKKISEITAIIGSSAWLLYWSGKWYKEWYFAEFGINFEMLNFDDSYYLFGSWFTIALTIACWAIITNALLIFILSYRAKRLWIILEMVLLLLCVSTIIYDNNCNVYLDINNWLARQLLISKDWFIILFGWLSIISMFLFLLKNEEIILDFYVKKAYWFNSRIKKISAIIIIFITIWISLGIFGYFLGKYHGHCAIWEGKMGTRWVKVGNSWYIMVIRTEDGRNMLYDRNKKNIKIFNDVQIQEIDGIVTKKDKI